MGQSFLLGYPEGGEGRLQDAVEKVDSAVCNIRDAGARCAPAPATASKCWRH
jgi:hypothetical protein